VASKAIGDVLLADVDGDLVKRVVDGLGSPKARATQLDAGDPQALRRAMEGFDLVVNTALPRFNSTIQAAARERGLHYLDPANDSRDPFADSDRWREKGLTAICAMGEDPGISNVFARHAADGMDSVDSIKVRDGDTASSPEHPFIALFSPETFVEETVASSRIWRDAAYEAVPPFGASETFEFPPPIGPLSVYSVDHEEVDTLPRFIGKGVRYADFKLALDDSTVQSLKLFRDLGLLEPGPPGGPSPRKGLFAALPKPADLAGHVDGHAVVLVEVAGEKGGERLTHTIYTMLDHRQAFERFGATATAYLTGSGMAAGAILLANGTIRERGKVSPESLDPKPFFPILRSFGLEVRETIRRERTLN
jgi:saccharopine dehydrogenase (NAD+, L-lysine-forming)